ncbi:hypothetical protein MLD38_035101 [Melastoma candidum]|uniref:Uncharacterized protein n=1 Tax=Melastoma candidum TaxID=119954 RepID=A0ACB9ME29_9MYRT|nr:hypothetical protein MLD38_035101 [Melastoma candidum]
MSPPTSQPPSGIPRAYSGLPTVEVSGRHLRNPPKIRQPRIPAAPRQLQQTPASLHPPDLVTKTCLPPLLPGAFELTEAVPHSSSALPDLATAVASILSGAPEPCNSDPRPTAAGLPLP